MNPSNDNQCDVFLLGIGTAVAEHSIKQTDALQLAKELLGNSEGSLKILPALYQKTRVGSRSSVVIEESLEGKKPKQSFFKPAYEKNLFGPTTHERMLCYAKNAPKLALSSSKQALADAGVRPDQITHLITVSCTGFSAPGFDIQLIEDLSLKRTVSRTHVGFMGCHGMFNALRMAEAVSKADPKNHVLVCSVELCSLHFSYHREPDQYVSNALFGDGSSASVVSTQVKEGKTPRYKLTYQGSEIFEGTKDAMSWSIGDNGFKMTLSAKVPDLIHKKLRPWLEDWLQKKKVKLDNICSWAIHPGGPKIVESVRKALKLTPQATEVSKAILSRYGNMSSATLLFLLQNLKEKKAKMPCVALGFGPGLCVEAALFE